MQCIKPIRIYKNLDRQKYPDGLEVPCGRCVACRISKRREWTLRMLHEMATWDKAIFVTLTYSDAHLPEYSSLCKKDLQKFFKRVRKSIEPAKIRYFACGEYGDLNARPHYHSIIFGLDLNDRDLLMKCWPYCDWNNQVIKKNAFGLAEPYSIQYVAQYIDKKLSGEEADIEYAKKNREPVFRILSNGLGKEYVFRHALQFVENEKITLHGKEVSFPRYYIKKLNLENNDFRKERALQKSREKVELYTGVKDVTIDEFYKKESAKNLRKLFKAIDAERIQREKNLNAKIQNTVQKKFDKI